MWVIGAIFGGLIIVSFVLGFLRLFGLQFNEVAVLGTIIGVVLLIYSPSIFRGAHYIFKKYPTNPIASGPQSTAQHRNAAVATSTIRDKIDADGEIAEATIRLERARMLLAEAERDFEEERRWNERRSS